MYEIKPLWNSNMEIIDLPNCMYQLKECDLYQNNAKSTIDDKTDSCEIRQNNLIDQLKNLRKQLADIRISLKMLDLPQNSFKDNQLKEESLNDIVINAHPNFVPYALLAMKNAWKTIFNIKVKAYSHSTISEISKEATEFQKNIEHPTFSSDLPSLNITLIWKNCEHTEMISSPTMYVPIYGEVNIVRFLGRIGPKEYRYENSILCNEMDAVMDICYQLLRCSTNKARSNLLRFLSIYLQEKEYFGGDSMSVADIAVYSSLKRLSQAFSSKDLTSNLKEWHKRVGVVTLI
ncbi:AIMP2 family protein [Megaselia abdita]